MNERLFPNHTEAPSPAAQQAFATAQEAFGMVPNLIRSMATAPELGNAYLALGDAFGRTSFSPVEQQVVLLTVSRIHGCRYCMAAHSMLAGMADMDADVLAALRAGEMLPNARLEALAAFVAALVESRGRPDSATQAAFFAAGYTPAQTLEILIGIAMKTLSNYTNHLAETPLDAAFESQRWDGPGF